jgi:hypothetical protein
MKFDIYLRRYFKGFKKADGPRINAPALNRTPLGIIRGMHNKMHTVCVHLESRTENRCTKA